MGEELQWACQNGDIDEITKKIAENPAIVKDATCFNGRSMMVVAADYGQAPVLELLIKKGADVNAADKHGITPLLSAIFEGHKECIILLLKHGAKKTGKAPDGSSYIDCAESDDIKNLLK